MNMYCEMKLRDQRSPNSNLYHLKKDTRRFSPLTIIRSRARRESVMWNDWMTRTAPGSQSLKYDRYSHYIASLAGICGVLCTVLWPVSPRTRRGELSRQWS